LIWSSGWPLGPSFRYLLRGGERGGTISALDSFVANLFAAERTYLHGSNSRACNGRISYPRGSDTCCARRNALGLQFTNPSAAPIASPQAQRSEVFMTPSPLRWLQPKNSNALHALASTFFLLLARGPAEALFVRVTQSRDTLRCSTVSAY